MTASGLDRPVRGMHFPIPLGTGKCDVELPRHAADKSKSGPLDRQGHVGHVPLQIAPPTNTEAVPAASHIGVALLVSVLL